jgi:hypothetical protein
MAQRKRVALIAILMAVIFSGVFGFIQAQEFGTNWSATFFPTDNLTGAGVPVPGITGINFNWGTGRPIINGSPVAISNCTAFNAPNAGQKSADCSNFFSARFTSTQNFNAGTYTFTAVSDDGVRVYIDGVLVLDKFSPHAQQTDTFTQSFATAGPHTLTVEYFEGIDQAIIQFQWGQTGTAATAGPSPTPGPTNTPLPTSLPQIPSGALTGTVIRASVLNVRAEPSVSSARVGRIRRGQTYQIIGRDKRAYWFLLQLSGFQGWVLGYYLYVNGNEFNAPVVSSFTTAGNPAASSPTGTVAQSFATVKLRGQPTIYAEQTGRITWGGRVAVVGRTISGEWWQVIWKGTVGWAWSGYFRVVEGSLDKVPIVQP